MDIVKSTSRVSGDVSHSGFPGGNPGLGGHDAASRLTPLQVIWHRRLIVLLTVAACVLGAWILSLVLPKTYARSTQIVVEPVSLKALGDGMNLEAYLNTQVELINKSSAIHAEAVTSLKDAGLVSLKLLQAPDALGALRQNLNAAVGKNDYSITVSYSASNAMEAALVVNAVVDAYTRFTTADTKKPNARSLEDLNAEVEKRQREIREQQDRQSKLKGEISMLQATESVASVNLEGLRKLSEALNAARLEAIQAQAAFEQYAKGVIGDADKLDKLLRTGEYNGIVVTPARDGDQLRAEMYAAQGRLNDLKERYLPNHPAVQSLQAKVDDLSASYVLFLHQHWVGSAAKAKKIEESFDVMQAVAAKRAEEVTRNLASKTAQSEELSRELERSSKLLSGLDQQMQEMSSIDRAGPVRIKVVERADEALTDVPPTKPRVGMLLAEGLMVGLILGLTLTFVDQRVRSIDEVAAATNLPILGVVPHMSRNLSLQSRGRKVQLDPMSDVAEAYRAIRTSVFFGSKAKTVLVTSATRAEGKSTLAANLAIAIAEAGQRVLLLDADLREPTQHKIFAANNDSGVSSIVAGRAAADRAIQSSGVRGLDLLCCGPVPFNPAETINNQTFADLLSELATKYDYVIVDSPPVMAVTDARILGAMCDVTLLVVRAERSNRRASGDARDGLLGFGANVLGVVINDGPRNRHRYGYYAGYGNRAGRGAAAPRTPADRPTLGSGTDFMVASQKR